MMPIILINLISQTIDEIYGSIDLDLLINFRNDYLEEPELLTDHLSPDSEWCQLMLEYIIPEEDDVGRKTTQAWYDFKVISEGKW